MEEIISSGAVPPIPASGHTVFQPAPPPILQYSPFASRLFAYFIDNCIVSAAILFLMVISFSTVDFFSGAGDVWPLFWLAFWFYNIVFIGYFTLSQGLSGQTFGKYLLGIQVVMADGAPISIGRALARTIGYYISGLFLYAGFIISLFDKRRQTFHDKIAGTVVVEKN